MEIGPFIRHKAATLNADGFKRWAVQWMEDTKVKMDESRVADASSRETQAAWFEQQCLMICRQLALLKNPDHYPSLSAPDGSKWLGWDTSNIAAGRTPSGKLVGWTVPHAQQAHNTEAGVERFTPSGSPPALQQRVIHRSPTPPHVRMSAALGLRQSRRLADGNRRPRPAHPGNVRHVAAFDPWALKPMLDHEGRVEGYALPAALNEPLNAGIDHFPTMTIGPRTYTLNASRFASNDGQLVEERGPLPQRYYGGRTSSERDADLDSINERRMRGNMPPPYSHSRPPPASTNGVGYDTYQRDYDRGRLDDQAQPDNTDQVMDEGQDPFAKATDGVQKRKGKKGRGFRQREQKRKEQARNIEILRRGQVPDFTEYERLAKKCRKRKVRK